MITRLALRDTGYLTIASIEKVGILNRCAASSLRVQWWEGGICSKRMCYALW